MTDPKMVRDEKYKINKEQRDSHEKDEFGTRIPSATREGGSRAFGPNDTVPVNVDPGYPDGFMFDPKDVKAGKPVRLPGQSSDVILTEVTHPGPADPLIHPVEDSSDMGEISKDMQPSAEVEALQPPLAAELAPATADYVRGLEQALKQANEMLKQARHELKKARTAAPIPAPDKKMVFDFGPPFGKMTTYYHGVIRDREFLVLVWKTGCKAGNKYEPAAMNKKPVRVEIGEQGEEHHVLSEGLSINLPEFGIEIITLLIFDAALEKMNEREGQ